MAQNREISNRAIMQTSVQYHSMKSEIYWSLILKFRKLKYSLQIKYDQLNIQNSPALLQLALPHSQHYFCETLLRIVSIRLIEIYKNNASNRDNE